MPARPAPNTIVAVGPLAFSNDLARSDLVGEADPHESEWLRGPGLEPYHVWLIRMVGTIGGQLAAYDRGRYKVSDADWHDKAVLHLQRCESRLAEVAMIAKQRDRAVLAGAIKVHRDRVTHTTDLDVIAAANADLWASVR